MVFDLTVAGVLMAGVLMAGVLMAGVLMAIMLMAWSCPSMFLLAVWVPNSSD
jgi:hypothetical protein